MEAELTGFLARTRPTTCSLTRRYEHGDLSYDYEVVVHATTQDLSAKRRVLR